MSVGSGLHAGEIECLVSRLVDNVRWLGVFARDELPDLTREIRPWCLILNTDSKDQPETHWLARYAHSARSIELFDSFGFSLCMSSLDFLDPLHSSYSLQSPSTSVFGHYCIVYIYLRSHNYSLYDIYDLLTDISNHDEWLKQYIYNMQICFFILNPCHRLTVLVNVANYNINFIKPIKCNRNEMNEIK